MSEPGICEPGAQLGLLETSRHAQLLRSRLDPVDRREGQVLSKEQDAQAMRAEMSCSSEFGSIGLRS